MEALEIIRTIAMICQITVSASGIGRDQRIDSGILQKDCHKYYAKCIYRKYARTESVMAEDLRKCMEER